MCLFVCHFLTIHHLPINYSIQILPFYSITETYLLACIVNYFATKSIYHEEDKGVRQGDLFMSWEGIFQDIRDAVDWLHERVKIFHFHVSHLHFVLVNKHDIS